MTKIIAFEGIDCSGKTTTLRHLANNLGDEQRFCFNDGVIFPGELSNSVKSLSNSCNLIEREILYTMSYLFDATNSIANSTISGKVYFRDRYWPSVIAYGRFLNGKRSIHNQIDFSPLFIRPTSIILLSCSYKEVLKRIKQRTNRSKIDEIILNEPLQFARLEEEINRSIRGLPNVIRIDTTGKTVERVVRDVRSYLQKINVL